MKTDDYFDADFDSDLGDTDSNTSLDHDLGAGEAYLANCGDYTLTENDLIDEELTTSAALYDPNSINNQIQLHRTYEADTAEAFRVMAERLEREDEAIIDSGSNIHLFTLEDAQKFFSALRRTKYGSYRH